MVAVDLSAGRVAGTVGVEAVVDLPGTPEEAAGASSRVEGAVVVVEIGRIAGVVVLRQKRAVGAVGIDLEVVR